MCTAFTHYFTGIPEIVGSTDQVFEPRNRS
jgi:hypothetical protein